MNDEHSGWPLREAEPVLRPPREEEPKPERTPEALPVAEAEPVAEPIAEPTEVVPAAEAEAETEAEAEPEPEPELPDLFSVEHAAGAFSVPEGLTVMEGAPAG